MKNIIILLILVATSCKGLKSVNDPTSTKQILWTKDYRDGRFYLNRFEVDSVLYRAVKIGDQFSLKGHYKYKMLSSEKN